jgi:hypothetical protein
MSAQRSGSQAANQQNRPVQTLRHRSIKATIWRNPTANGDLFNVTISRSYRDKTTDEWRETQSIGYDDLMNLAALMYEAHAFISSTLAEAAASKRDVRRK